MPSPTQKSTHVKSVTGFSKNSVDCSVVLNRPPTNATDQDHPDDRKNGPTRRRTGTGRPAMLRRLRLGDRQSAAGAESRTAVPPAATYSQIGSGNL